MTKLLIPCPNFCTDNFLFIIKLIHLYYRMENIKVNELIAEVDKIESEVEKILRPYKRQHFM